MVDVHTPEQRSYNMAKIRSRDTKPELLLRKGLSARGYRYRLHLAKLPGAPDLVFPGRKKVVFVNGCFWHSHTCKYGRVRPATRPEFWAEKRAATVARDARNTEELERSGWSVLTVWECELRNLDQAILKVTTFLDS